MSAAETALESRITRFIFEDLDICGALVQLQGAWQQMQAGRDYPDAIVAPLGEMTAVAALIASQLKQPGRASFQAQGQGPVSLLVVDGELTDEALLLRGMARCDSDLPQAGLAELLGDGQLLFSLHNPALDMPYQSIVPLEGGSMTAIFERFMTQSAQQPTRFFLAAGRHQACALFLQALPPRAHVDGHEPDADGWQRVQQLAATVQPAELQLPAEQLLLRLFNEEVLRVFDPLPVRYYCPRDEDKVRSMLLSLGRDEVAEALSEHSELIIRDEICNHEYRFGPSILDELFPSAGQTLH